MDEKERKPRGLRLCNPGNIEHTDAYLWRGEVYPPKEIDGHVETRFVQFIDHFHGIRALAKVLLTYYRKYGINTVEDVINRWAPPSENDTESYVDSVSRVVRVRSDELIDMDDADILLRFVKAITQHENGMMPYPDKTIKEGVNMALET